MTALHRPGPPAAFPLDRWLPIHREPAPTPDRRYPVPTVYQNGAAESSTDAIWDAATAKAAQQRPGEMAICRACGRLTQIYARGVCRTDYDRYQRGEIQEHVLSPAPPPIPLGATVPLAGAVPGVLTVESAPAPPPKPGRRRALLPQQLERALPAPAGLPPPPQTEEPAPPAPAPTVPRRRSLDRLIAELYAARTARAALDSKIADLEAELRARLPADLLPLAANA